MKATIHKSVSYEKLRRMLPEPFAGLLPHSIAEPITAVVFRERVVTGRMAQKALQQDSSDSGSALLFVGRAFTLEAGEAVTAAGGLLLYSATEALLWSDQSLFAIRALIATNKKGPEDVGL